jgi:hypothetical protein
MKRSTQNLLAKACSPGKTKGDGTRTEARLPRKAALQKIDGMVDQDRAKNPLRFGEHVLQ